MSTRRVHWKYADGEFRHGRGNSYATVTWRGTNKYLVFACAPRGAAFAYEKGLVAGLEAACDQGIKWLRRLRRNAFGNGGLVGLRVKAREATMGRGAT